MSARIALLVLAATAGVTTLPARADELGELRNLRDTTVNLVNLLVEEGVLSREKADALILKAQASAAQGATPSTTQAGAAVAGAGAAVAAGADAALPAAAGANVVRVPYVPQVVKEEITAEVKQDVLTQARAERWGDPGALPEWLDRISFAGDVRLRNQLDLFPDDNIPNSVGAAYYLERYGVENVTDTDNRLRLRARFGAQARVNQYVRAGFRLATGGVGYGSNPASENQTLGNYESRSAAGIDRAYIAVTPASWVELIGGRIGTPFYRPTDLIYSDDLSLEGIAANLDAPFGGGLAGFATVGVFPIDDISPSSTSDADNKWLFGYQLGLDWAFADQSRLKGAIAYYDYSRMGGVLNPSAVSTVNDLTAPPFRQKANSVFDINYYANLENGTQDYLWGLVSNFEELELTASLDLGNYDPVHVILDASAVKNLGFDRDDIRYRTAGTVDIDERTNGYQARLTVGHPELDEAGSWQGFFGYRYLERDAVVDAFTDTVFHLGGTDTEGYFVGARYSPFPRTTGTLRWMSAKEIDGPPLAIDVLVVDFTTAF